MEVGTVESATESSSSNDEHEQSGEKTWETELEDPKSCRDMVPI